jgi:hypothetical protein
MDRIGEDQFRQIVEHLDPRSLSGPIVVDREGGLCMTVGVRPYQIKFDEAREKPYGIVHEIGPLPRHAGDNRIGRISR